MFVLSYAKMFLGIIFWNWFFNSYLHYFAVLNPSLFLKTVRGVFIPLPVPNQAYRA